MSASAALKSGQQVDKRGRGRPPIIPRDLENALAQRVVEYSQADRTIDPAAFCDVVAELVQIANLHPSKKDWEPSYDWYEGFMRRHPELTVKRTKPTKTSSSSPRVYKSFMRMYEKYLEVTDDMDLVHTGGSTRLFNMDETGVRLPNRPVKKVRPHTVHMQWHDMGACYYRCH